MSWTKADLGNGIHLLAQRAGLSAGASNEGSVSAETSTIPHLAASLGLTAQAVNWRYRDYRMLLQLAAPAVLQVEISAEIRYLLLLRRGQKQITLLTPDQKQVRLPIATLLAPLQAQEAGSLGAEADALLAKTQLPSDRIPIARAALLAEQLNGKQLSGCWLLQPAANASLWQRLRQTRLMRHLLTIFSTAVTQQALTLGAWYMIGRSALRQHFEPFVVAAWILLLLTVIPVQMTGLWAQSVLALDTGKLFRSRLLRGILNLRPNDIRHQGSGQFLERVMQTESFQSLLLGGGLTILLALIQLVSAFVVLSLGAGGWLHAFSLAGWMMLTGLVIARYTFAYNRWSDTYRSLTNDLVERMVGQRTRLAQASQATWHVAEDAQLEQYQQTTQQVDRWQLVLNALVNRGWLVVGLAGIALPFVSETPDATHLAISLGGIVLASGALSAISAGVLSLARVMKTWRDIGPLLQAAATSAENREIVLDTTASAGGALVVARDIEFNYRPNAKPVFSGINLDIAHGDRLLLEGASGGGKSTFASLLMGLRQPTSGLLLLHGLDQPTMGLTNWRQRVVAAPQFHENHILTETFAFNLLMGRRWPATEEDLRAAAQICYELGLGDLLERMPSGMQQMIGEGGWQLSHGERSRLFIARTLLQNADLIVLDESFAALDPANLRLAIECVLRRAPTLLVIAHP
ncbi:MAG: ATP-binding cassette domain-containing protein [Candidatus Promineifilaceae bacterium]